jgi:ammonia channel protein AmtB
VLWSVGVTYGITKLAGLLVNLRARPEAEIEGLDMHVHGERAWHGLN